MVLAEPLNRLSVKVINVNEEDKDLIMRNLNLYYSHLEKALEAAKRLYSLHVIPEIDPLFQVCEYLSYGAEDWKSLEPVEALEAFLREKITEKTLHLYMCSGK